MHRIKKKLKNSYVGLKILEFKYRFYFKKQYDLMSHAVERFKSCKSKKPRKQIKREMRVCKDYWKCYPLHYIRYELYKKDKVLSENELINYIPEFFFYNIFLPFFNMDEFGFIVNDKIRTENYFKSLNIAQPLTIAKLINKQLYTSDLRIADFNSINKELHNNNYKKIFIKPAKGRGGYGIDIFHRNLNDEYLTEDNLLFTKEFLLQIGEKDNYIIQPGLKQSPKISRIYPFSLNTFRIVTERKDNSTRIICATLRIGINNCQLDNVSQGGVRVVIDINKCILGDLATNRICEVFYKHPNTNFIFKGYKISDWQSIKNFTIENAAKIPYFIYIGWDIALTLDGPVAIEANLDFGLDHFQVPIGGLREYFKIDNPDFYWRNLKNKHIKRPSFF